MPRKTTILLRHDAIIQRGMELSALDEAGFLRAGAMRLAQEYIQEEEHRKRLLEHAARYGRSGDPDIVRRPPDDPPPPPPPPAPAK